MRVVLCAEGAVEPQAALKHYLTHHPATPDDPVHLVFGMRRSVPDLPQTPDASFTVGTFVPGRGLRDLDPVTYHRSSYSEICASLQDGSFAPDVVISCATTPDAEGHRMLGGIDGYLGLALEVAHTVVLEEVAWLPRIPGSARASAAAHVIASANRDDDAVEPFGQAFDAVDTTVAGHVATLLPDHPGLALGIGRVTDALADQLWGRGDVDVITGVVTEAVRTMHERGAASRLPMRAMSVVGSPSLLRWAAASGVVELLPSTKIHNPSWLASHDRFVSVLGALEVDLHGSVNSELSGRRLVSGKGGAPDLARGAHNSPGGLSIVALCSKDRHGRSRLVPELQDPSLPAEIVDAVVTENGVALLEGLAPRDRRRALEAIF